MRETPIGIGQHRSNWAPRPRVRTHPEVFQYALGCAKPRPRASRPAEHWDNGLGQNSIGDTHQTGSDFDRRRQRRQRGRDSRLGLDQPGRRSGRSPGQPTTYKPADLDRNRKGAPSHPRSNGQALDEARNPVTVAGRRCCRASGRVRPRWDQAFPCYSPLAWVVGAGPSAVPSGEHPPAGGPALPG
jgi:hypothetical protein